MRGINIKNIFLKAIVSLSIVLMLLTPAINIPGPFFIKSLDVYAAFAFLIVFTLFTLHRMKAPLTLLLIISVFLLLLSQMIFLEIIYGHGDYTGISLAARSLITVIVAYGCTQALIKLYGEKGLSIFVKLVIFCALLQGAILWLSFLFPIVREWMSVLFYRDFSRDADHLILLRVPGFVSTGGDGLSMNHALLCVMGLAGIYVTSPPNQLRCFIITILFISMLGAAFTGRSGLYLGFFFMVTLILIQKKRYFDIGKMYRVFVCVFLLIVVLFFLGNALGNFGQDILDDHGYEHPVVRLLRGFIEMQKSGSYSDNTVRTLLIDMVVFPEDPMRFLFGNNYFGPMPSSNLHTDVGYLRMLHGVGFFGLFVFLVGVFIVPIMHARFTMKNLLLKTSNLVDRRFFKILSQLMIVIFIFGLIGHYKIFFLSTRIYLFVFFVFLFLVLNRYKMAERTTF
ncbi:hypothetical protein NLU14_01785 [Marinobacter sp. 71-i]|uniref:O-antigen ligase domain-containing protein n=1 Tax=Marinobacter iranensis TaxID=2962607 RepID=A0ABT5Y5K6_9GAMM|nr:hypothetical protein [Marinobacter iranensis]MDF0748957.1 hypothetical protein [Marinobacter iranensis]